jgi:hypothetical protein
MLARALAALRRGGAGACIWVCAGGACCAHQCARQGMLLTNPTVKDALGIPPPPKTEAQRALDLSARVINPNRHVPVCYVCVRLRDAAPCNVEDVDAGVAGVSTQQLCGTEATSQGGRDGVRVDGLHTPQEAEDQEAQEERLALRSAVDS